MNRDLHRYGDRALVAGAAEGIGAAFSSLLAEAGMDLIMIDHNRSALDSLADELEQKHRINTIRIHKDLAETGAAEECFRQLNNTGFRLLVYVPAYSPIGRFADHSVDELERYLSLNVRTPTRMVHMFLNNQKKGNPAGMILMSSLAGMVGPALAAPYSGTKAYLMILAESLYYELKDQPVDVLACCAGPTSTPTYWSSNPAKQNSVVKVMDPARVASSALRNLGKRPFCITGRMNRLFYFILTRLLPRRAAGSIVSRSMMKMYA